MPLLKDKVSLITGGASGLGREFCAQFGAEGARVIVADRNIDGAEATAKAIRDRGGDAGSIELDVADAAKVDAAIASVVAEHGRLDVLCNNAGVAGQSVKAVEVSEESWDRVLSINLKSVFLMSKAAVPHMIRRGGGVIINIASAAGSVASAAGVEYTAAKHGVVGLTKQLSYEYGHQGVRVVAVSPGVIEGTQLTAGEGIKVGRFKELTMNAPAGRYGKPIEVARLVVFLASDDASFIHGSSIPVDGGSTIY